MGILAHTRYVRGAATSMRTMCGDTSKFHVEVGLPQLRFESALNRVCPSPRGWGRKREEGKFAIMTILNLPG